MISKKTVKKLVKAGIWIYLIVTVCPQAVDAVCEATGTILSEGLKWCGGKIWEGMTNSDRACDILDNEQPGSKAVREWIQGIPDRGRVTNEELPGNKAVREWLKNFIDKGKVTNEVLPGNKAVKEFMEKALKDGKVSGRPLDAEDMRIISDIMINGGTFISKETIAK